MQVQEMLSADKQNPKCPAKDVRDELVGFTDFSNLHNGDFAHAEAILTSSAGALPPVKLLVF